MQAYAADVTGIDSSEVSVSQAVSPHVELGDATNLRFPDGTFDKVFSLHTIEHVPDPGAFLAEIGRVLKPGGLAVIVYPWELFRGMQAIGAAIRLYRNPFRAGRIHLHRLTPQALEQRAQETGLDHQQSRFVPAVGLQFMSILTKTS